MSSDPVRSARPDLLERYEQGTRSSVDELNTSIATAHAAKVAYEASCAAYPVTWPISPRRAAADASALGTATAQIGEAFRSADRDHDGAGAAHASDARLSAILARDAPGLTDRLLTAPARYAAGQKAAERFRHLGPDDVTQRMQELAGSEAATDPAWAAGFLDALGADGLIDLVGAIDRAYAERTITSLDRADAMIRTIGGLVERADGSLDAGLFHDLGASTAGRDVLRHLSIGAVAMPTERSVAIATEITLTDTRRDESTRAGAWSLLQHRMNRHRLGRGGNAPGLALLAADPVAARLWDDRGPDRPSPFELNLAWTDPAERDLMARIGEAIVIDPVLMGTELGDTLAFVGANRPDGPFQRKRRAFFEAFKAETGSETISVVMQKYREAHPRVYDLALRRDASRGEISQETIDLFTPLVAHGAARRRAIEALRDRTERAAERAVAATSPTGHGRADPNPFRMVEEMEATSLEARTLQLAAYQQGRLDDPILNGLGALLGLGGKEVGRRLPAKIGATAGIPGKVAGIAAGKLVGCVTDELDEKVVHPNERWDQDVIATLDVAPAAFIAEAMARQPGWAEELIDVEMLTGLDPTASARDAKVLQEWISRQSDRAREPLDLAYQDHLPVDYLIEQGCSLDSMLPGGG